MSAPVKAEDVIIRGLRRGARHLRVLALTEAALGLVIFLGWYLFIEIILDHIFSLSPGVRMGLLAVMAAAATAIVVAGIALPVVRTINRLYIARSVEYAFPEFKNSLVTFVQLEKSADEDGAVAMAGRQAARRFEGLDVVSVLRGTHFSSLGPAFVILALSVFFYSAFGPKSMSVSFLRSIFPWSHIAPPTRTHILAVLPGDTRIAQGADLAVSASISGPGEASVKWSRDGELWQAVPMRASVPC